MEKNILAAMMQTREAYEAWQECGSDKELSPLGGAVLSAIREYYQTDPDARSADRGIIEARLTRATASTRNATALREYLETLPRDVSVRNIVSDIREVRRRYVGNTLSLALANGGERKDIARLIGEYNALDGDEPTPSSADLINPFDTTDLLQEQTDVRYIKLWPKGLNRRLGGGALRGHHVLIFARPEGGKTLFAINLVAGFLSQDLRVLYIGNEEPTQDIRDRIRSRVLRTTVGTIRTGGSEKLVGPLAHAARGYIRVAGDASSFGVVRKLLKDDGQYDVLVLDQIRNMRIKRADSRVDELEAAGLEARALAKEHNVLVVSVTQAGNTADGKIYLDMSDVDSSKTGLPASADLMIGLGSDRATHSNGLLGVSLCKNKLSGRHDQFMVEVDYSTGVVK